MIAYTHKNLLNACSQIQNYSKFITTISHLFTRQFKIIELQKTKLSLFCISLLLNSFITKRLIVKSSELCCDLFRGNASNQINLTYVYMSYYSLRDISKKLETNFDEIC